MKARQGHAFIKAYKDYGKTKGASTMSKTTIKAVSFNNFQEMKEYLINFNKAFYGKKQLNYCYIVFTKDSFDKEYDEFNRTYCFSSDNKMFRTNCISTSLFADCLDGTDRGVRLDWYMKDCGNPDGWKVKECWLATGE